MHLALRAGTPLIVAGALWLTACNSAQGEGPRAAPSAAVPANDAKTYGSPITTGEKASLVEVLSAPDRFKDRAVIVEGAVRRACSRKGCWMEIAESTDAAKPGARVTFKDYSFFVPTDSAGSRARVQGSIVVQQISASHVEHMESEGAHFAAKNADGTANEVRMVATGVELTKG